MLTHHLFIHDIEEERNNAEDPQAHATLTGALALMHVADAQYQIAEALRRLGNNDADTPMGGMEALGKCVLDGTERISESLDGLSTVLVNKRS